MVKKITNNDLNEAKKGAAVVDFSAVWCGPCQMLAPVMEELSEELSGKAEFYNADSDENMGLAQEYRIVSIPAVIVLKDGVEVARTAGIQPFLPLPRHRVKRWRGSGKNGWMPAERRNAQLYRGTSELERADCELAHRLGTTWIAEWCAGRNEDYHAR